MCITGYKPSSLEEASYLVPFKQDVVSRKIAQYMLKWHKRRRQ